MSVYEADTDSEGWGSTQADDWEEMPLDDEDVMDNKSPADDADAGADADADAGMDHKSPQLGDRSPTPELPLITSSPPPRASSPILFPSSPMLFPFEPSSSLPSSTSSTSTSTSTSTPIDDEMPHEIIIHNFRSLPSEYHPPNFTKWGYQWRLNVFPKGFNDSPNAMGLFLLMDAPSNIRTPQMYFSLITVHPTDTTKNHIMSSHHNFVGGVDCGYRSYLSFHELDRFLHDGALKLQIGILKGTEPEKRSIPLGYNSRRETGLVGLKNQGATCYMNSLLQTLFLIPRFRHAVYNLPLDDIKNGESKKPSLTLALQRVFYQLQFDDESVTTKYLTQSFGWNSMESFMQHDVQEFARVLLDSVDEKMKGTAVQGMIAQLFEGRSQMFIECLHVDFKSSRTETFLDLQLNVKGFPDLISSFKNYVEIEELKEGNQYRAEGHGLQDARKGTRFLSFPPVLQLQLKRFAYDPATDAMTKIHDRFEFPERLDLTEFLPESERNPDDPAIYHLHSVLVHSGSAHGGHYTCYIRPIPRITEYQHAPWFKFDDETVTKATAEEAIAGNFGGNMIARGRTGLTIELQQVRISNAYMLVYLRQNETKVREFQGFGDVKMKQDTAAEMKEMEIKVDHIKEHDFVVVPIPKQLQQRMEEEKRIAEEALKEEREKHLYTQLKVYSEPLAIGCPCDFDLQYKRMIDGIESDRSHHMQMSTRLLKDATFEETATTWEQVTGIPSERQQYWQIVTRPDKTHRPMAPILSTDLIQACDSNLYIRDTLDDFHPTTLSASSDLTPYSFISQYSRRGDRVLLLFKYFDLASQKCIFVGSTIVWTHCNMNQVKRYVRMRLDKLGYRREKKYHKENDKEKEEKKENSEDEKQDGKQQDGDVKQEHNDTTMTDTVKSLSQGLSITDGEGKKGENDVDIADIEQEQDPLDVWKEMNIKMEPLASCDGHSIISSLRPLHGDLYVFQRRYSSAQLSEMKSQWDEQHHTNHTQTMPFFISAAEYADALAHSITLELRPFPHATDPYHIKANPQIISLHLRGNMPYHELFTHIERALGQDLDRVTLTLSTDPASPSPTVLSAANRDMRLSDCFRHNILYYQFHTLTHTQRKNMICFNIQYYGWKPTKPMHEFEVYVDRHGMVSDLEQAIRDKLNELDPEHTGKRKEHEPVNIESTQEQNDVKRQKLEIEHATQQPEPGAMESDKTGVATEASSVPSPPASASATDSSTLTSSPFSPSGSLVVGILPSFMTGMKMFFSNDSIELASHECDGGSVIYMTHQRHSVQAMEMTHEQYTWLKQYQSQRKQQQEQAVVMSSQLHWFYPCLHPCGDGVETGFPLVITNDMTVLDVRNKVAQRLRDQKPERWKIVKLQTRAHTQPTFRDDVPFLQQVHRHDRIGVINTEERVIPKKPSWAPRAAAVKIHQ